MSEVLEELMRSSRKGYIDRYETIDWIVGSLLDTPEDALVRNDFGFADRLRTKTYVDDAPGYRFTLADLMCMTTAARACDNECFDFFRNAVRISDIIRSGAQTSNMARLFMGVSFRAFAGYVDKKSGTSRGSAIYSTAAKLLKEHLGITVCESSVIGTVLDASVNAVSYWNRMMSMKDFSKRAEAYFMVTEMIVIESMALCFPEKFRLGSLQERTDKYGPCWELPWRDYDIPDPILDKILDGTFSCSASFRDRGADYDRLTPGYAHAADGGADPGPSWDEITRRIRRSQYDKMRKELAEAQQTVAKMRELVEQMKNQSA